MQDTNIVILFGDNGGKTVVMNRSDYNVTMMGMLCDSRTYEKMPPNIVEWVHPTYDEKSNKLLINRQLIIWKKWLRPLKI